MHHYTCEELAAQEAQGDVSFNSHLGTFTNFVNLLGMCAVSIPFTSFEHPAPAAQVRPQQLIVFSGIVFSFSCVPPRLMRPNR